MLKGDQCWIIENGMSIVSVEILSISGNLFLIKTEKGKTLRLSRHRIYETKEKAMEVLQRFRSGSQKRAPHDYME